jgi:tellurite resistance protein TerC
MVEFIDLIFAVDSIPAIFAITQDPYIIYTSNIFAILGLRALYFALASIIDRFYYLKYALAAVLIFIGSKIFIADVLNLAKIPPMLSLTITVTILAFGVLCSFIKERTITKDNGDVNG